MTIEITRDSVPLDPSVLESFQRRMRGELLTPDAVAYATARSAHNQRSNERPALIARCLSAHDVALAIALARELSLEIAVHNDAHSLAGPGVTAGGLLIDLSQLRQIMIDPLQRIAHVQPGATNDDLVKAAAAHGLATTGNILAFEVVTAQGTIITASAYEHADLFSTLHRSINTFGVVTAIIYRLRLSPPEPANKTGDNP